MEIGVLFDDSSKHKAKFCTDITWYQALDKCNEWPQHYLENYKVNCPIYIPPVLPESQASIPLRFTLWLAISKIFATFCFLIVYNVNFNLFSILHFKIPRSNQLSCGLSQETVIKIVWLKKNHTVSAEEVEFGKSYIFLEKSRASNGSQMILNTTKSKVPHNVLLVQVLLVIYTM